ncbi:MAG: helix-turn-helix domain-containing protein [Actinomycetota bacterium]|nr:helix-turn-helix domain-containing protein [Actinomycetota bacterium]
MRTSPQTASVTTVGSDGRSDPSAAPAPGVSSARTALRAARAAPAGAPRPQGTVPSDRPAPQGTLAGLAGGRPKRAPSRRLLLTIEETAEMVGLSCSALYRAVATGRVPFPVFQIGGCRYVPRAAIARLLAGADPRGELEGVASP